jgi:hypothetical protein
MGGSADVLVSFAHLVNLLKEAIERAEDVVCVPCALGGITCLGNCCGSTRQAAGLRSTDRPRMRSISTRPQIRGYVEERTSTG